MSLTADFRRLLVSVCLVVSSLGFAAAQDWTTFEGLRHSLKLDEGVEDLSELGSIQLPEPSIAYVNIQGSGTLPPATKVSYVNGWMEFYDGQGHYLRKRVRMHGQGGYSIRYPKKNISFVLCENDYTEDLTTDVQIGDWVVQDGFHLKAFWTDFSRGLGEMGYKMFYLMLADRRPYWERGGYGRASIARCIPDGFPCAVYINGKFFGIYAWQLKKHRRNMNMKKSLAEHIHLDGNVSDTYLFRGSISWSQFEVRNPKGLFAQTGAEYNGNQPRELMDKTSSYYYNERDDEATREMKERSVKVKESIVALSKYHSQLQQMEKNGASASAIKEAFGKMFDVESLVDYAVFYYLSANGDGTLKNWQWFTYDGVRWMVAPYDLDQTFGINLYAVVRPATFDVSVLDNGPFYWINRYYQDEICQRYAVLRRNRVIAAETLVPIVTDWCERVGEKFYEMERQKWPQSPCYCEAICNEPWSIYEAWENYSKAPAYSSSTQYSAGDYCKLEGRLWQTSASSKGINPFSRNANIDTQERLKAWIPARIAHLDEMFGYRDETGIVSHADNDADGEAVAIYTLSGVRIAQPTEAGIYIYKYKNGATRKVSLR